MDRRDFLRHGVAATAAVGLLPAAAGLTTEQAGVAPVAAPPPRLRPADSVELAGLTALTAFTHRGQAWTVHEDLRPPQGVLVLACAAGVLELGKRTEAVWGSSDTPYFGMPLAELAMAEADLLADRLLRQGDPSEAEVRDVAPPPASRLDPKDYNGRLPWTTFVGTVQGKDTMPIYPDGRSRTYRAIQYFPELTDADKVAHRSEGLLGGWMPAVHKVIPAGEGRWYDLLVFADVNARDAFVVQTWNRAVLVEQGKAVRTVYGYSYPDYPPRRGGASAQDFYRGMIDFAAAWQAQLAQASTLELPDASWPDMARFAFARELIVRPGGVFPKYGAVDRDYVGNEYDGFQDTFTSSLYANLEWGRFDQARAVLDNYLSDYTQPDGLVNMRGPETGQFGLTLSLLARYLRYTGDVALLRKHQGKIEATAQLLVELHDASLQLPRDDRGHGLIHGWSESDACLYPDPSLWWKPYFGNSALAIRGWEDIAAVWTAIAGAPGRSSQWRQRARQLRQRLLESIRADIRTDLKPAYVGPLPGTRETFRQAMSQEDPSKSEQLWSHRAYAELLQADVLPDALAHLVIDCLRGHGGTTLGIVSNIWKPTPEGRDILGFISYGYAQQLLRLDRIEEYLLFLYAHRYQAHTRGSWTAGEVAGITGGMPLFCMPAQMTAPLLLRWMLVFDQDQDLYLARGLPRDWLATGEPILLEDAPTPWGRVAVSMQAQPEQSLIQAQVSLPALQPRAVWLTLRAPAGKTLREVSIAGVPAALSGPHRDRVALPFSASGKVSIEARYA
ncbi:Tat pathway signal protein [Pseudoxanthomonas winnipegensis]|uniref:Tat pathway signal protein n=1 Tax=Pseudoxanthomonas winnipegensis TaxID=2480810 RepID=A0A4Q8M778_9GAMM|nr:Tat pathway signal protein [Pseudoxanthomonas winnipegensis]TAA46303.1 Tat pathway signal protein [Pseudoxanthomonas winnipegensis]